jgi:uncharacterized repeat protein (TIGR03803 family)
MTTMIMVGIVLFLLSATAAVGQTFSVIHNFSGAEGAEPYSGVTVDRAGNLYGTGWLGGVGYGTVYKLSRSGSGWIASTLYQFQHGTDGNGPQGRVIFGPDGALYGTTYAGGSGSCNLYLYGGCGTVFRLTPPSHFCASISCPWAETVLYRFTGGADGADPSSELTFDAAGNLYGTAAGGGNGNCTDGCGTVFKLTHTNGGWSFSVLYTFTGQSDGWGPASPLVFDGAGNLYGTTPYGGQGSGGTVFELTPGASGWTLTTLYSFQGLSDGAYPRAGVTFDRGGNIYGATTSFGAYGVAGTAFELVSPGGSFNLLYGFPWMQYSNGGPWGSLTMDQAGNLYGTTYSDGAFGFGSVFKLTPGSGGWTYTSLHDFTDRDDGANPLGGVAFDANGDLYGTTTLGGTGNGVVFRITP